MLPGGQVVPRPVGGVVSTSERVAPCQEEWQLCFLDFLKTFVSFLHLLEAVGLMVFKD